MQQNYDWAWVVEQAARTAETWRECGGSLPQNGARFSSQQQRDREAAYDEALELVEDELEREPGSDAERMLMRERLIAAFGLFSSRALDLEQAAIDLLTREFLPVGAHLAQRARSFDPELAMPGIIQACRNAWTACGLQPLVGERVQITPAILGYSLLYPYSDNFLDDRDVPAEAKLRFSARFRRRLHGYDVPAGNALEQALWRSIELIEGQFERSRFPQVYNCLLSIHRAQERSMRQIDGQNHYSEAETLRLSCEKGGSSVLADACLARGSLTEQESRFAFEWGVLLQLGDDLQDVHEDLFRGSKTLFSDAAARAQPLDALTVQLLRFAEHVAEQMDRLPEGSPTLKNLLKMSWQSLIIRAVADSQEFFSARFVREAEQRSPFRFDFLRRRQQRIAARHGLYERMFEAFLAVPEARENVLV